jgi:aldehyde dehydrogenase (NAD+)
MFVPRDRHDEALEIARVTAEKVKPAIPNGPESGMGPLANANQFAKVNAMIRKGVEEGAKLVAGGPVRLEGFYRGYFVRPTVFGNVNNDMVIDDHSDGSDASDDDNAIRNHVQTMTQSL